MSDDAEIVENHPDEINDDVHVAEETSTLCCIICNGPVGTSTSKPINIFNMRVCSSRRLNHAMEDLLEEEITEETVHSPFICKGCFELFDEFESSQARIDQIKEGIVDSFRKTLDYVRGKEISDNECKENVRRVMVTREDKDTEEALDDAYTDEDSNNAHEISEDANSQPSVFDEATLHNIEMQLGRIHGDEEGTQIISAVDENGQSIVLGNLQELSQFGYVIDSNGTVIHQPQDADQEYEDNSGAEDADSNEDLAVPSTSSNVPPKNVNHVVIKEEAHDIEQIIKPTILRKKEVFVQPKFNLAKKIKDESTAPIVTREDNIYTCLLCTNEPARLEAKEAIAHIRDTHGERLYVCDICGDFFRKRNQFQAHMDDHINNDDGDFQCEVCNRIFNNLRLFRIHKRMHQPQNKAWACDMCGKKYSSKNLLEEHTNTHTGNRPYSCGVCNKNFTSKYTIKAHMKTHGHRPRPFECATCSKSFMSQQNLTQHERTHSGVKEFSCEHCHKKFGSAHNLEVHSVVHTGHKAFKCRTCGKAFARKAEIRDHERTHTGEKPYQCEMCGATFSQRSNLQSHKRATHYNDKRYKCQVCGKGFKRRRLLEYHIKAAHTGERPFKCDLCGATFVYPEHFKKHARIHTGEKPYSCEICGKHFNSRDNRNSHRYVHSDKKPYECIRCGVGFMRKPLLYQHMRSSGHLNDTIVVNQPHLKHNHQKVISADGEAVEFIPTTSQISYSHLTEGLSETVSTSDGTQVYITDMLDSEEGTLVNLEEGETVESTGEVSHIIINGDDLQYVEGEEMELEGEEQHVFVDGSQVLCIDKFLPEIVEEADDDSGESYQYIQVKLAGDDDDKKTWIKVAQNRS